MSISFKKYAEFVALPDEPSDEQITEIFGLFKNNDKVEKLKAEREKLRKQTQKKVDDWKMKKELDAAAKNAGQRPTAMPRSAAAAGKAAERDWVANMAEALALEDIDASATEKEAMRIIADLKKQFDVKFETTKNKNGTITITMNNNYVAGPEHKDKGIVTVKNISDAVDKDFREFRQKGWTFTQPQGGSFTIGVPEEAMMESDNLYSEINDAASSIGTMKELTSKVRDRVIHHLNARPSLAIMDDEDIKELLRKANGEEKFALRVAMKVIGRRDPSE